MADYITTYTEEHFYPTNPDPDKLKPEDIAHSLSLQCRGNGHVKVFFSVAQHCINCAKEAEARGLSPREAARVQTFPDDYFFQGGQNLWYAQIGNAVPVKLAEVIGKSIMYFMKRFEK